MDFLGRVEAALRQMAVRNGTPTGDPVDILVWCASTVEATRDSHRRLLDTATPQRAASSRSDDDLVFAPTPPQPEMLAADPGMGPTGLLWCHWELVLYVRANPGTIGETLFNGLWESSCSSQSPAGHLHPLTPDTLLDAFVYDELTALHAAYRSAVALRDKTKLNQCRRIVEYHVANTQPDHTTAEPWALAAFAALDDTHTFAEQQLHDATTAATAHENPIILALLADAVLAMREARELQ